MPKYGLEGHSKDKGTEEKNSAASSAGCLIADIVGIGLLEMPVVIAQFGWALGGVLCIGALAMNTHVTMLMWRVWMANPDARTLPQLVDMAFSKAPRTQRMFAVTSAVQLQTICTFACCSAYLLGAGKGLGNLFYQVRICLPVWALAPCAVLLPFLGSARELGTFKPLLWFNVCVLGFAIGIPLLAMSSAAAAPDAPERQVDAVAEVTYGSVLLGFSMMNFAYAPQDVAVEVIGEMENPADFPRMYYRLALPYQAVLFLAVGVGGYVLTGNQVQGMISDNVAFGPLFRAAALCNVVNMLIVFVMKGVIPARVIHRCIAGEGAEKDDSPEGWRGWRLSISILIAASYLITQLVPFCVDLVDFVGALLLPLLDYILPIVFYLRWLQDSGTKSDQIGCLEKCFLALYCVMALIISIVGTYAATQRIMTSWAFYGNPFECHCEMLWNTCDCSSAHLGMESCDQSDHGSGFWSTMPVAVLRGAFGKGGGDL